jgi:uncharacterized protein (TIGR02217 family)
VTLANGFEERNTPWAHARRRYDAGVGMRSLDDIETLISFFEARQGQLFGFRWKDWSDFKSSKASADIDFRDQVIGQGDGAQHVFRIHKVYQSGDAKYERPVFKPVAGTVRVGVADTQQQEAVDFTLNTATGEVTLAQAPAPGEQVTAGFEFDVPVRFDTDRIQTSVASFQVGDMPNVPVVEVRV